MTETPPARTQNRNEYEFDGAESRAIVALARVMTVAAVLTCLSALNSVAGAFTWVRGLTVFFSPTVVALLVLLAGGMLVANLLIGFWTLSAAAAFRRAGLTRGNDVANVMEALANLQRLFGAARLVFIALAFVVPVAFVGALDPVKKAFVAGAMVLSLAVINFVARKYTQ